MLHAVRPWLGLPLLAVCACAWMLAFSTPLHARTLTLNWTVFHGIPAQVQAVLPAGEPTEAALKARLDAIFARIDARYNAFNPQSDLARLNAAATAIVAVDPGFYSEFHTLWQAAYVVHHASQGAFDPTIWPLKKLWQEAEKRQTLPAPEAIAAARATLGLDKIVFLDGARITRPLGTQIDLGGIVKGFTVDKLVAEIKEAGIHAGLVQVGGEIRVFGRRENGEPWRLGVQHPLQLDALWGSLEADTELAVSTSGNYRQPVEIAGKTYYHIFDPHTGEPISTNVLGVTVVRTGGGLLANTYADAWTKAMAVPGPERGLDIARANGFEVLYILRQSESTTPQTRMSEGMRRYFRAAE